jgi:CubicO group peptidase (beta-lactamase class C family)
MLTVPRSRAFFVMRPAIACFLLAFSVLRASAQAFPPAPPDSVGISAERLNRLSKSMQEFVDRRRAAGIVTIVVREGKLVQLAAYGKRDIEANAPMQTDTIFRIASMSKAITSTAVMLLMEDGKLLLSDPVSKFIPSFKDSTVGVAAAAGAPADAPIGVLPAKREITIRDLLTHTAGISYGGGPAASQWKAAGLNSFYCADKDETIGTLVERMGKLPMDAQPGEKWIYGYNTDILGAVVEKVSGLPLDEFFRTRIFEPLKMTDTSFYLPIEKRARLAAVYVLKDAAATVERAPDPGLGQGDYVDGPRKCFSGGAGLLSTATDYARFLQMMVNGGELDGVRLLSPKTVELITSNHVGTLFNEGKSGFGLGFEIVDTVGAVGLPGSPGTFSWGGAYHTSYWADPKEKIVAVLMTQLLPANGSDLLNKFRVLVYQSVVAPAGQQAIPPAKKK